MPLEVQEPRPLSPLEREAVELVFWDSLDPCDVYLRVIDDPKVHNGGNRDDGNIWINKYVFPYADALNIDSTLANTDILKPGNMKYLSTLIHECTHSWQHAYKRYTDRGPEDPVPYDFSWDELQTLKFMKEKHPDLGKPYESLGKQHELLKEQYASAAQVYFLIAWQLKYSSNSLVNLTSAGVGAVLGRVERYHKIAAIPTAHPLDPVPSDDSCKAAPPGRRVSRGCASRLSSHFNVYLVDLRSGGRKQWAG